MMGLDHIPAVHEAMMTDVLGGGHDKGGESMDMSTDSPKGKLPVMALVAGALATPVQFGLGGAVQLEPGLTALAFRHFSA